ncbi:MAG: TVP38/TMEM64 family protein [Clostridia bacterium]|nr:TVP38/TMEM64 family protein [Clostridia bacterium]
MKKEKTKRQIYIKALSVLLMVMVLAGLLVLVKSYFDGKFNSIDSFQEYIEGFGAFGPVFLTVFQAAQVVLPVLPGFLGCAVGTVMFGPVVGFICNYVGISAGSIIAYFLARKYGTPLIRDLFHGEKYKKYIEWAARSKTYTSFLFMAMVLPLFPDDFFCYLTGLTNMKPKKFIWIIILGKPWCILAYSLGFALID